MVFFFAPVKPLLLVYARYTDYNPSNTLIIDDNQITYSDNVENAISVKPFYYNLLDEDMQVNLDTKDTELLEAIAKIEARITS